jgi:site-specific recombinase XerD
LAEKGNKRKAERELARIRSEFVPPKNGFVFVDKMGERMKMNYLTSAFPKFLESHGLRRMRFCDLWHSCASLLLANGVPLKHIQEWLGHSDFTTTVNIKYPHKFKVTVKAA